MKGFLRLLLILVMSLSLVHCASTGEDGDSPATDQEFEDFDSSADSGGQASQGSGSIEDELNQAEGAPPAEPQQSVADQQAPAENNLEDEFAQFEKEAAQPAEKTVEQPTPVETPIEPPPPEIAQELPQDLAPPIVETVPQVEEVPPAQDRIAKIKNIKYKANDNGGTIVIEADGPLTYDTRINADTNQFVIEVPQAELPAKLKRPFNTKDMKGGIGSIDAYQNKGSTTARIVIQLREGIAEPTVQAEGNSLLVVQSDGAMMASKEAPSAEIISVDSATSESAEAVEQAPKTALLSSGSLKEFLSNNTQFYGKKISLEVSEMDVREVFRLISEESGVNLVLSDDVKGSVSLKLRQVPWDQALVVIMKARKLGYTRAGSILRIAPIGDLKAEEEDSVKLANNRKAQSPLTVRVIPVSYAKIEDLVTQVKNFLSDRGKVIADVRTSSIVVSDSDENIARVAKLISSIDVPPAQVLIEGKIVEANDKFQRDIGVNWSARLPEGEVTRNSQGRAVRATGGLVSVTPSMGDAASGSIRFALGTLDILGDLNATLSLFESQNAVKILSSPRILTIHNVPALISQTSEVPVPKETTINGVVTRTTEFKPVTLSLSVTPQITNDASVILSVDVNRDVSLGQGAVGKRNAKTTVMVRNSQTAVIGGIYQSDELTSESKVPWVGDIPILGWLFKSKGSQNSKNELMIFLTPRIVGQAPTMAQSSNSEMPKETF